MKKILCMTLVLASLLCCLVSCGEEKKGYEACIAVLEDALYVPNSLIIYSASSCTDKEENCVYYKVVYDAQNRLGIYGGKETLYFKYDIASGEVDMAEADSSYGKLYSVSYALLIAKEANGENVHYKEYD